MQHVLETFKEQFDLMMSRNFEGYALISNKYYLMRNVADDKIFYGLTQISKYTLVTMNVINHSAFKDAQQVAIEKTLKEFEEMVSKAKHIFEDFGNLKIQYLLDALDTIGNGKLRRDGYSLIFRQWDGIIVETNDEPLVKVYVKNKFNEKEITNAFFLLKEALQEMFSF